MLPSDIITSEQPMNDPTNTKTTNTKKHLHNFLLKPLAATIFLISAMAASQSVLANSCSCDNSAIPTVSIEESNDAHPNQLTLESNNAYYRLIDQNGKILQDRLYDVTPYPDGRIAAKRDGRVGLISAKGQLLFGFDYDDIEVLPADLYILSKHLGARTMNALVKADINNWLYPVSGKMKDNINIESLYYDETNSIGYFKVTENGKVGLISDQKQTLIPIVYDELELLDTCPNERLFMTAKMGNKTGLIDQYQQFIVPLTRDQTIENYNEDAQIFKVRKYTHDTYTNEDSFISEALIKGKGQMLLTSDTPIENLTGNLYRFSRDGKYGVINEAADVLLPAIYEHISSSWDMPLVVTYEGKQGIVRQDESNKQLVVKQYYDQLISTDTTDQTLMQLRSPPAEDIEVDDAYERVEDEVEIEAEAEESVASAMDYHFEDNLYIAKANNKFGLVDSKDTIRMPFLYDEITEYANVLLVKRNQKYGLLTTHNETIVPISFDDISLLKENETGSLHRVAQGGKQGVIDAVGRQVLPLSELRFAIDKMDELASLPIIEKNGKYGWLNDDLNTIKVAPDFEDIKEIMSNGTYIAQKDGKKVLIDADGKVLSTDLSQYDYINDLYSTNMLRVVDKNGKQGVINNKGEIIVALNYDGIGVLNFSNNTDHNGYIDSKTNKNSEQEKNYYMVELDEKYGLLDENGKTLIEVKYPMMSSLYYSPYLIVANFDAENPKFGLINSTGKVVKGFDYDEIFDDRSYENHNIYMINTDKEVVEIYDSNLKLVKKMSSQEYEQQLNDER